MTTRSSLGLLGILAAASTALDFDSPTDLALGKDVTVSSHATVNNGDLSNLVCNSCAENICDSFQTYPPVTDPWVSVDLGQSYVISRVVINMGPEWTFRVNPFNIKVDDVYCKLQDGTENWNIVANSFGDFTCSQPVSGQHVKIVLPGLKRLFCSVLQVRVYEAFDTSTFNGTDSSHCYTNDAVVGVEHEHRRRGNGNRRRRNMLTPMESCSTCSGPGPTQCLSCSSTHAFLPWRTRGDKPEGACLRFPVWESRRRGG